jgi:NTE family protein
MIARRQALAAGGAALFSAGCTISSGEDHSGEDAPRAAPLARPARTAWVLGSGGPRGFVHVGVLRALADLGLAPDLVVGASVGAVVGGLRAAGLSAVQIEKLALELKAFTLARVDLAGLFGRWTTGKGDRLSAAPIGELVREHARAHAREARIERLPVAFACVAQRRRDGVPVAFTAGDIGVAVQASAAVVGEFAPVRIRGESYADADWVTPLPVRVARALGARRVLAIDASAHVDRAPPGAESYRASDLKKQALIAVDARDADLVLKPDFGYWAGLSREYRERAIAAGYRDTMAEAGRLRALHAAG